MAWLPLQKRKENFENNQFSNDQFVSGSFTEDCNLMYANLANLMLTRWILKLLGGSVAFR